MFAGVDHGCWSCIFKFRTQATVASTTGEKCFVCYTEYNTHGIYEHIEICVFLVHKATNHETITTNNSWESLAIGRNPLLMNQLSKRIPMSLHPRMDPALGAQQPTVQHRRTLPRSSTVSSSGVLITLIYLSLSLSIYIYIYTHILIYI